MKIRFFRKKEGKLLTGLCSGLSESLSINVWIIRIVFIALTGVGGLGAVAYISLSIALSYKDSPKHFQKRFLGFCDNLSRRWNLDISIIRLLMSIFIVASVVIPGLICYGFMTLLLKGLYDEPPPRDIQN